MPDPSLSHIALTCDDPIAVERFYTKHFGFHRARVVDMGQGAQIVFLRGAGTVLELFRADEPKPVAQATGDGYHWSGVRNISFEVDDVDRKIEEMGSDAVVTFGPLGFDNVHSRLALGMAARSDRQHHPDHQRLYRPAEPAAAAAGMIDRRLGSRLTERTESGFAVMPRGPWLDMVRARRAGRG